MFPASIRDRISTDTASPYPLWPAMGIIEPCIPILGSVVGAPSGSTAHPSGIILPALAAWMILNPATAVVAMSITIGSPSLTGNAKHRGLVPNIFSLPPQGAALGKPEV